MHSTVELVLTTNNTIMLRFQPPEQLEQQQRQPAQRQRRQRQPQQAQQPAPDLGPELQLAAAAVAAARANQPHPHTARHQAAAELCRAGWFGKEAATAAAAAGDDDSQPTWQSPNSRSLAWRQKLAQRWPTWQQEATPPALTLGQGDEEGEVAALQRLGDCIMEAREAGRQLLRLGPGRQDAIGGVLLCRPLPTDATYDEVLRLADFNSVVLDPVSGVRQSEWLHLASRLCCACSQGLHSSATVPMPVLIQCCPAASSGPWAGPVPLL